MLTTYILIGSERCPPRADRSSPALVAIQSGAPRIKNREGASGARRRTCPGSLSQVAQCKAGAAWPHPPEDRNPERGLPFRAPRRCTIAPRGRPFEDGANMIWRDRLFVPCGQGLFLTASAGRRCASPLIGVCFCWMIHGSDEHWCARCTFPLVFGGGGASIGVLNNSTVPINSNARRMHADRLQDVRRLFVQHLCDVIFLVFTACRSHLNAKQEVHYLLARLRSSVIRWH